MQEKSFIFDYAKCVGCHACIVACHVENKTNPPIAWRQVCSFNPLKIPLAGFLNLSIACNHCAEAPCLKACPAKAYIKDLQTGAIIHQPEKCIGCRFCTWACPFDAPKFNSDKGIVEKCHLCNHLTSQGALPACAKQCPTGALSYGAIDISHDSESIGISKTTFQPRIKTIRSNVVESIPTMDIRKSGYGQDSFNTVSKPTNSKIHAKDEWPLVLFTYIFTFLTGAIFYFTTNDCYLLKVVFVTLGVAGLFLSTFHLGKPIRAARSLLNLKTSWLSREILFGGLFFISSFVYLFIIKELYILAITSLISLGFLVSIEMVYSVTSRNYKTLIHSSNTLLTSLLFCFLFLAQWKPLFVILALKALLYLIRKALTANNASFQVAILSVFRVLLGLVYPLGIIAFGPRPSVLLLLIAFLIGELIDRYDFYNEIDVNTPSKRMENDLSNLEQVNTTR